jgi:FkbM family methyltransferase
VTEQEFTGWYRRIHRAVIGLADKISTPDSVLRRRLSPAYTTLLYGLSAGRGTPADINGETYRIDPRFRWHLHPRYEAELAAFLRARLRPGQCCIDVGANIGIYVMQMARWVAPGGRIVAFEPNPGTFEVLARHVRMNDLGERVTLVPLAAGCEAGAARLFDDQAGSGLSRLGGANPSIGGPVAATDVQVTTLDAYCSNTGTRPDWILIDVEGYEFDVLAGAVETIRRLRPGVIVELHPHLYPDGETTRAEGARLIRDLGLVPVPVDDPTRDPWSAGAVSLQFAVRS